VCGKLLVMFPHPAQQVATRGGPPDCQEFMPAIYRAALRRADHACCCSAKPTVVAVMPPAPGRDHATELLLCGHHHRASREALAAAGATCFGEDGARVMSQAMAPVCTR
jgi:hypothetical protein